MPHSVDAGAAVDIHRGEGFDGHGQAGWGLDDGVDSGGAAPRLQDTLQERWH